MSKQQRIFIVGHMGAGKAVLSEGLAQKLGWEYIDANPSLERYIGRNLIDIVGQQGEEAFHRCEGEIVSYYRQKDRVVVVLEEAVIATPENRKLLASECVVYAKVSVDVQLKRLPQGRAPLLPIADWKSFLEKQHQERDSLYEEVATITIDTSNTVNVDDDVNKVVKELGLA